MCRCLLARAICLRTEKVVTRECSIYGYEFVVYCRLIKTTRNSSKITLLNSYNSFCLFKEVLLMLLANQQQDFLVFLYKQQTLFCKG